MIKDFLTENLENFQEEFDNLDTKDKLKFIADILPYGLPKYQPMEIEKNVNGLEAQKNAFQQVNDYLEANNYTTDGIEDTPPITSY